MFSLLRNRFGIPGVISVIALVFAMFGGAYAASSNNGKATASAKAKKGPRGPKGPAGPAGPAGAQGPAGANGKDGANGSNGTNGAPGKSVESIEFGPTEEEERGEPCDERGGSELIAANGTTFACNGEQGSPWTADGTLPKGATETGTWVVEKGTVGSISFPIRIPASPVNKVKVAKEATPPEQCDDGQGEPASGINPEADEGYLCIFMLDSEPPDFISAFGAGALLLWSTEQAQADGTFAVTAAAAP